MFSNLSWVNDEDMVNYTAKAMNTDDPQTSEYKDGLVKFHIFPPKHHHLNPHGIGRLYKGSDKLPRPSFRL